MKKSVKRLLSSFLVIIMLVGIVPFTGLGITASAVEYEVGDIIEFGSYPQSEVTDTALLSKLNSLSLSWVSYGYYSGTDDFADGKMQPGDWMKYADVTYNGERYRAVTFTEYRPEDTYLLKHGTHLQYANGYYANTIYWFKFEPLEWRVLDPDDGFMVCESIIDSQPYNNTIYCYNEEYYQNASCTTYANDYAESSIRTWLNDDFYNTAFTSSEKAEIKTTTCDNSSYSNSKYDSATTNDNIFLLSWDEVTNSEYGFDPNYSAYDTARRALGTDYAKVQGLGVCLDSIEYSEYYLNSIWMLRSPDVNSAVECVVSYFGHCYNRMTCSTFLGVRPALKLNTCDHSYSSKVTIEPTYTTEGERTYTCEKCGDTYTEAIPVVPYPGNDDAVLSLSLIEETDTHVLLGARVVKGCIAALDIGIYPQSGLIGQCSDMYLSEYVDRLMDMDLAAAACNKETCLAAYAKVDGLDVGEYILFAEFEKKSNEKVTENDFVLGVSNCCDPSNEKLNCSVVYDFSSNHKHEYTSEVTKEQTCTEDGIITYTCFCGDSYTEIIPKAHNYNHISVPSTCTVTGMEYDICSDCGEVINSKVLPLASHTLSHVVVASTCTVEGMEYDICSVCGGTFNTAVLPLAPHSWSEWKIVREATAALEGLKERSCTVCGTTEEELIPKLNVIVDDESGISIEFNDEYDSGVEIKVEEVFDGDSFQIIDLYNGNNQSVIFDITTVKDGEKVQPNGKVKVRVPIPEGFDEEKLFVCYVDSTNGTVTNIPATIVDGYIEFFAEHFSYYAIVEKLGKVKSVSIDDISMSYKDSVTVTPNINVDAGVDYTVTYSSSNTDVVSVDANGKLTTNGKGSATITVTVTDEYGNTVTDTCKVNVNYKWWQWIIVIVLFGWIWY